MFYFLIQQKRDTFPYHENIDLLSMPLMPQQNSNDAHALHLEDKEEARTQTALQHSSYFRSLGR